MPGEAHQAPFINLLQELQDARTGLPVSSHRQSPVGPAIVFAKKVFRRSLSPLINELLKKQALFNENVVSFAHALFRDVRSLESSMIGIRGGLDERMGKLEDAIARLQVKVDALGSGAGPAAQTGLPVNGSAKPNA